MYKRQTVYNKCDKPGALSFDPDILLTSAKTGYGLDTLLAKLDEVLSDRVHTLKVLLPLSLIHISARSCSVEAKPSGRAAKY